MENVVKKVVLSFLQHCARKRISRSTVTIIGVTGSVAKTSAKEAIALVLSKKYKVLRSQKSFNSEFGLPLTILEQKSGFSSAFAWLFILLYSFLNSFKKLPYDALVLEMGVDKPGDMDNLLSIARPKIGVLTGVEKIHLDREQFSSIEAIFEEKVKLLKSLPEDGVAIINADSPILRKIKDISATTVYFSMNKSELTSHNESSKDDDGRFSSSKSRWIRAREIVSFFSPPRCNIQFNVAYEGTECKAELPILGKHHVSTILPAIVCGIEMGMTLKECVSALAHFTLPPGRMTLIEGVNESIIIDSSYNASPYAMEKALDVLNELNVDYGSKRKIAVIGNMNELGSYSQGCHQSIGRKAAHIADVLITVGESAKECGVAAFNEGFAKDRLYHFNTAIEAGAFLKTQLHQGDLVLIKGSQNNVRLEHAVEMLMAHPEKASTLLVRQEKEWKNQT